MFKRRLGAACAAVMLVVSACNGNDVVDLDPTTHVVSVSARDFDFVVNDAQAGVVTFEATNDGDQLHHFILLGLPDGTTEQQLREALEEEDEEEVVDWIEDAGGIEVLEPDATISVTRQLDAGTYAFVCFLPSPDHEMQPHYLLGMYEIFELRGTSEAEMPAADHTLTITDDAIQGPGEIDSGTTVFEVRNERAEGDMVFFLRPRNDEMPEVEAIDDWFDDGMEGDSPVIWDGGTLVGPGETQYVVIDLVSGHTYRLVTDQDQTLDIVVR